MTPDMLELMNMAADNAIKIFYLRCDSHKQVLKMFQNASKCHALFVLVLIS